MVIKGYALVDPADAPLVMQWDWLMMASRTSESREPTYYAYRYETTEGGRQHIYMHRELLGLPRSKGELETDHINGDGFDNRRANLRILSGSAHRRRHGLQRELSPVSNVTGERHIHWDPKGDYWVARISILGKRLRKRFKTIDEARHQVHQWQSQEAVS